MKQLKAAIKNNLPQILKVTFIGIIALCLLLLIVSLFVPGYQKTLKTQIKQANSTIGGIVDGITVKQSFTAEKKNFVEYGCDLAPIKEKIRVVSFIFVFLEKENLKRLPTFS